MNKQFWGSSWLQYILVALISLLLVCLLWGPWLGSLNIPLQYNGDYILSLSTVKGIIQNGWVMENQWLGAPFSQTMFDFPMPETLLFLMIKGLSLFSKDPIFVLNLFYLLGFPLVALTSLYALKGLGLRYSLALPGALASAFIPYHFLRLEHVFLAAYFMLPPMILLAVKIMEGKLAILTWDVRARKFGLAWKDRQTWIAILICILAGSTGLYYTFFLVFMMAVVLVKRILEETKPLRFDGSLTAILLAGVLVATLAANLLPFYLAQFGQPYLSLPVMRRQPLETEFYGLKLIQMLLPRPGHQIALFSGLNTFYQTRFADYQENTGASLGMIGSLGFLFSIAVLFKKPTGSKTPLLSLSALNLSIFLLGTIGGIGSIVSFLISPQIRSINRVSVMISFLSIAVSMLLLDQLLEAVKPVLGRTNWRIGSAVIVFVVAALMGLVYVDQCGNPKTAADVQGVRAAYENDRNYVQAIEAQAPQDGMIFQLPYVDFPEGETKFNVTGYEHLKLYLASDRLRWSFGGMRYRLGGNWYRDIAAEPMPDFLHSLALAGFTGISINRNGYDPKTLPAFEKELSSQVGEIKLETSTKDLAYYDLRSFTAQDRARFTQAEWDRQVEEVMYPVYRQVSVGQKSGMYEPLYNASGTFQYSVKDSGLILWNMSQKDQTIHLQFSVATATNKPANLSIQSPQWTKTYPIDGKMRILEHDYTIPAGQKEILSFHCDADYYRPASGDPRLVAFKFADLKFTRAK